MILDKIENTSLYKGLSAKIAKGLKYISSTELVDLPVGKYEIAEGVHAIVSEYETTEEENGKLEAHKKHIDIQYIIAGQEQIGYVPLNGQVPSVAYNAEKDVVFYNEEVSFTKLGTGMFAIYYPTDLHMPGIKCGGASKVKKLVIKIKVD